MDDDNLFGTDDGIYPPFPPKNEIEKKFRSITSVQLIHSVVLGLILGGVLILIFDKYLLRCGP